MPVRRQDDRIAQLVLACPPGAPRGVGVAGTVAGAAVETRVYVLDPSAVRLLPSAEGLADRPAANTTFLLSQLGGDLLLVTGEDVKRVPRLEEEDGLQQRLLNVALEAQRTAARRRARQSQREAYLLLSEGLVRAENATDVHAALLEHAVPVVGGSEALLAIRDPGGKGSEAALDWRKARSPGNGLPRLPADVAARLSAPGTPVLVEREGTDPAAPALEPLFSATGATRFACAGLGSHGLLLVAERRADREFCADDWHLLRLIARHAETTLDRLAA